MIPRRAFAVLGACLAVGALPLEARADQLLGFVPVAGTLEGGQLTRGPLNFGVSAERMNAGQTLYELNFAYREAPYFFESRIGADPADIMGTIVTDLWVAYAGQTGTFLPINLIPYMGLGGGLFGVASSGGMPDLSLPIYAPIGLQYNLPLGPFVIGADATYFWQLAEMSGSHSRFDVTRMRYEATLRMDWLSVGAFTESGTSLSGNGVRVGMNF